MAKQDRTLNLVTAFVAVILTLVVAICIFSLALLFELIGKLA